MPIMPISDGNGGFVSRAGLVVLSTMLFPTDDELRAEFEASYIFGAYFAAGNKATLTQEEMKALDAGPGREAFCREIDDRQWRASCAAGVLLFFAHHYERDPKSASLRKAIHVVWQQLQGARMPDGSQPRAQSERTIRKWWTEFRSVVHLWSAWFIQGTGTVAKDPESVVDRLSNAEALTRLLSVGEGFRRTAGRIAANTWLPNPNAKSSVYCWVPPDDLRFPVVHVQSPNEMIDLQRRMLANYRAK